MISKPIFLYDPAEKPYGHLSNNYDQKFEVRTTELPRIPLNISKHEKDEYRKLIDDQIYRDSWYTMTNYIYTNMLTDPSNKLRLKSAESTNVISEFKKLYVEEFKKSLNKAYSVAFAALINQSPKIKQKLLDTGNAKLVWISESPIVAISEQNNIEYHDISGTINILDIAISEYVATFAHKSPYIVINGKNYYGDNMLGEILMNFRRGLNIARDKEKSQEKIKALQRMLLVRKNLEEKLSKKIDLLEYTNKTYEELYEMLGIKDQKFMDDKLLMNLISKGRIPHLEEVEDPCLLIMRLRQEQEKIQTSMRNSSIFNMYVDYLLEKNYPNISPENRPEARRQQLVKLHTDERVKLTTDLYKLYQRGLLSDRLSQEMDKHIENYNIINTENDAELVGSKCTKSTQEHILSSDNVVEITDKGQDEYSIMFSRTIARDPLIIIDGLKYPTINHYMFFFLISNLVGMMKGGIALYKSGKVPLKPQYKDFLSLKDIGEKYKGIKDNHLYNTLASLTRSGLESKFKDRNLQNLLLYTGDSDIIWNDHDDFYLGSGTKEKPGNNTVGKLLRELRRQITHEREQEDKIAELSESDIRELLSSKNEDSTFLKDWLRMRIKDICTILSIMNDYGESKGIITQDENFIRKVFYTIYHPCDTIYRTSEKMRILNPSDEFRDMIRNIRGFCSSDTLSEGLVPVIWQYLVSTLYYLKDNGDGTFLDISKKIAEAEFMVSNNKTCIPMYGNKQDDCKVSALANVLTSLVNFQEKMDVENITLDDEEFDAAIFIILGKYTPKKQANKVIAKKSEQTSDEEKDEEKEDEEEDEEEDKEEDKEEDEEEKDYGENDEDFIAELESGLEVEDYSPPRVTDYSTAVLNHVPEKYIRDKAKFLTRFHEAINTLKEARGDKEVITNRINYFSSW